MAEWLKAHAWKACLGETLTRVRIPLSPPDSGVGFACPGFQNGERMSVDAATGEVLLFGDAINDRELLNITQRHRKHRIVLVEAP